MQRGDVLTNFFGNVCVNCQLLPGSPAPACLATFSDASSEGGSEIDLLLPAPKFTACMNLPSGVFRVVLKDVNSSGDAEMGVAYHIQELITVKQTTTHVPGTCLQRDHFTHSLLIILCLEF